MPTQFDITDITEDMAEEATIAELSGAANIIKNALTAKKLGAKVRVAQLKQELEELKPRRAKREKKLTKKQKRAKAAVAVAADGDDEE